MQFNAFNELVIIINLINGHKRTPKIEALKRLIEFLKLHYPNLPIDNFKPLDTSPIISNAWLSLMLGYLVCGMLMEDLAE